jgi:hypothetical protein
MNLKKKIFLVKFFIIFKIINNGEYILNRLKIFVEMRKKKNLWLERKIFIEL